jgi:hypothetical protein
MKTTTIILLIFFLFLGCNNPNKKLIKKDFLDKIQELVLSENKIDQEYFFKVMLKNKVLEYRITYIGNVINTQKDSLKFVTTNIYSGNYEDSKGGDAIIWIYNSNNQKMGYYYIGGAIKTPLKIIKNNLFLPIQNTNCNQTTTISFKDSIPKEIFINCTEKGGDLYNFRLVDICNSNLQIKKDL